MAKKVYFKVWTEVEKITEYPDGYAEYEDLQTPVGVAIRKTEEEASKLQEDIHKIYRNY